MLKAAFQQHTAHTLKTEAANPPDVDIGFYQAQLCKNYQSPRLDTLFSRSDAETKRADRAGDNQPRVYLDSLRRSTLRGCSGRHFLPSFFPHLNHCHYFPCSPTDESSRTVEAGLRACPFYFLPCFTVYRLVASL